MQAKQKEKQKVKTEPKERGQGQKPTKLEKERRINDVQDLLIMGMHPKDIWRYLTEKKQLTVSQRTVERYVAEATERIKTDAKTDRQYQLGKAILRLESLYQRDIAIQDYKAALGVVREINALLGLAEPIKTTSDITSLGKAINLHVIYEDKLPPPEDPTEADTEPEE